MEYIVEEGIPLIDNGSGRPRGGSKYPFASMEVGQSFLFPCNLAQDSKARGRIANAACNAQKMTTARFSIRKFEGGLRIWRIA